VLIDGITGTIGAVSSAIGAFQSTQGGVLDKLWGSAKAFGKSMVKSVASSVVSTVASMAVPFLLLGSVFSGPAIVVGIAAAMGAGFLVDKALEWVWPEKEAPEGSILDTLPKQPSQLNANGIVSNIHKRLDGYRQAGINPENPYFNARMNAALDAAGYYKRY
jgi:hypothetical protein